MDLDFGGGEACFFVGTEEGVSSPDAVYEVFVTYAATAFG